MTLPRNYVRIENDLKIVLLILSISDYHITYEI